MMLALHKSKLFTVDPAIRFAEQHRVSPTVWNEVWKRYLAEYDCEALAGYVLYKTGIRLRVKVIQHWINRTNVYCKANHIMLMGVRVVQSEYFGEYEDFVMKEVLRNMKYSGKQNSRIMV